MPCYHPLDGWRSKTVNASGKRGIVFNPSDGFLDMPIRVPCGQCIGCRLERSRQWAIRCVHEASLYEKNCFITLTYSNEYLPKDGSLVLEHFQKFMKRLRKRFGSGIRFFHCGEYGAKGGRPHYHACLFNFDFSDKEVWSVKDGIKLYRSKALEELWSDPVTDVPYGFATVGEVTFESAAYVARYILKKQKGDLAIFHYNTINPLTGEITAERSPEYVTMSRRPGIGKGWYEKFKSDVYPGDFVEFRGQRFRPPKYYDSIFEIDNPETFRMLKASRSAAALSNMDENSFERLAVREECQEIKLKKLIRSYENG